MAALANDLSGLNCTANDVQILGVGQVINEDCACSGTFNARVQFTVRNNSNAERRCITLHLAPVTLPGGGTFAPPDVVLEGSLPGKTTQVMTGTIAGFPCGAGLLCFGEFLPGQENVDAKGLRCPDGKRCSTVSWTVRPNDVCGPDADVIPSKCRHQQICIQGRGAVTLDCNPGTQAVDTNCTIACGGSGTLRLCISGGPGPFTFTLLGGPAPLTFEGGAGVLCHDFTVSPTQTTVYTGRVTDSTGCSRDSVPVTLTVNNITPVINVAGTGDCEGLLTISTTAAGFSGCTFSYTIDGVAAANTATDTKVVRLNTPVAGQMTYRNLDGNCHTIGVTASCGGCTGTATKIVTQCVETTFTCPPSTS